MMKQQENRLVEEIFWILNKSHKVNATLQNKQAHFDIWRIGFI